MDFVNQITLLGAGLVILAIFAGMITTRTGAPLLLVFLALGMLAGEDGPGGILFDDFEATYIVGSTALAIILFDGGLRTPRASFRLAGWPAIVLASAGVLVTAGLTGAFTVYALGAPWIVGLLVGSIVASTDAAAVFLLLHMRGMRLKERVSATLELESGLNDPMAVFLTVTCVELLAAGALDFDWALLDDFALKIALQLLGGAALGIAGGYVLLWVLNRAELAPGLYPILAVASALLIYAGAQLVGASGFLAAYLAGVVLGNHRHRATLSISRFHDGLAWLSQIVMFLMLGLLVTPSQLLPTLLASLAIAFFLIFVGRPVAVWLGLLPFRYTWQERLFISWVGLRGAVPIFLGTIPLLANIQGAQVFFGVAYVVVLTSLVVQGWTVAPVARWLDLELPSLPPAPQRTDIATGEDGGRTVAAYTVEPMTLVVDRPLKQLPLPEGAGIVSVVRDDVIRAPDEIGKLAAGDRALVQCDPAGLAVLDALFAAPASRRARPSIESLFGEFTLDGSAPLDAVGRLYDIAVPEDARTATVGDYVLGRLRGRAVAGDRVPLASVELVVRDMAEGRIVRVGIELEPESWWHRHVYPLGAWLSARLGRRRPALPAPAAKAIVARADRSTPAAPESPPTSGS
ncbi:MAG: potassium/proton antiporter [Candidatus Eiseniibacteriota bacterium]